MSMIRCAGCDRILDAKDEGLEGIYEDKSPFRYWCPTCVEDMDDTHMLLALQAQEPERFKELSEQ